VAETTVLPEVTSAAMLLAESADCSASVLQYSEIVPSDSDTTLSDNTLSDIALSDIDVSDPAAETSCEPRVGHHNDGFSKKTCCSRPGCYVRFHVTTRSPRQRFCSLACRNALRCVRQREAHWFEQLGMSSRHRGPPADDDG